MRYLKTKNQLLLHGHLTQLSFTEDYEYFYSLTLCNKYFDIFILDYCYASEDTFGHYLSTEYFLRTQRLFSFFSS